jgi:hypothetical protein
MENRCRHELGHAAVWYFHGGAVGRLKMSRMGRQLGAGVRQRSRSGEVGDIETYFERVTERLLAGELAARRHLGLPLDQVSIGASRPVGPAATWSPFDVFGSFENPSEDVARAVHVAARHALWVEWLMERLAAAAKIIEEQWQAIDHAATELTTNVPRADGGCYERSGGSLIALLRHHGLRPRLQDHRTGVEALSAEDPPSLWSWPGRLARALWRPAIRWRWVDGDEEPEVDVHPVHRARAPVPRAGRPFSGPNRRGRP